MTSKSDVQKLCSNKIYKSGVHRWRTKVTYKSDVHKWRSKVTSKHHIQKRHKKRNRSIYIKIYFWMFLVSGLLSAHVKRFSVSCICFFKLENWKEQLALCHQSAETGWSQPPDGTNTTTKKCPPKILVLAKNGTLQSKGNTFLSSSNDNSNKTVFLWFL